MISCTKLVNCQGFFFNLLVLFGMIECKPRRNLCMLGKGSTTELHPQLLVCGARASPVPQGWPETHQLPASAS